MTTQTAFKKPIFLQKVERLAIKREKTPIPLKIHAILLRKGCEMRISKTKVENNNGASTMEMRSGSTKTKSFRPKKDEDSGSMKVLVEVV